MKKEEYMGALKSALAQFDQELVQEIVMDYEERFRVGAENGKTEEMVIQELGNIRDLVDELSDIQQTPPPFSREKEKEDSGQESKNKTEQEEQENSGTYYQEKSFAETFNSAMKKFGKVFNGVMKEAGRVLEEAAEKIEFHMEESKKNHYYTYQGDGTYTGSEKEAEGEPNVEQSGCGMEGCRRIVVDTDIADVKIRMVKEREPKAVCHYYSHKTAMIYPFYAGQEGDTFYVRLRYNKEAECRSGFFQFSMSPSAQIDLMIPEGVVLIEANNMSGNLELNEINTETVVLNSKSGNITASYLTCEKCRMEAMSGDLELTKSSAKMAELTSKSGDCTVDRLEGETLIIKTASGSAKVTSVQSVSCTVNTMSGDIDADALNCQNMKFHTASGDVKLSDCRGDILEAGTASGDLELRADSKRYILNSTSGDIRLESRHDADMTVQNTSGDVEIHIVEALETYQVNMHSVSGECSTFGQTKSADTVPSKTIEAKTISGDICVRFL